MLHGILCQSVFSHYDKIPQKISLKKERCILAQFQSFQPMVSLPDCFVLMARQYISVVEACGRYDCSLHGGQETKIEWRDSSSQHVLLGYAPDDLTSFY
jgi:hypothetical protein